MVAVFENLSKLSLIVVLNFEIGIIWNNLYNVLIRNRRDALRFRVPQARVAPQLVLLVLSLRFEHIVLVLLDLAGGQDALDVVQDEVTLECH